MDPREALTEGQAILDPVLEPAGFRFVLGNQGPSSGGRFASGAYIRGDRRIELHFRHSLGLVRYRAGDRAVGHEGLLRYLGVYDQRAYPGFSDDPLDGFRHLRDDIENFGEPFLKGSDRDVHALLENAGRAEAARPSGIKALP